jgi:hypothetical protein
LRLSELISGGNAVRDGREFNQWFVGDLAAWSRANGLAGGEKEAGLRQSHTVEVKWAHHPAGLHRPGGWTTPSEATSLCVLVRGDLEMIFRPPSAAGSKQSYRLQEEGDYLIWSEQIVHTWVARADTLIVTVRWREAPPPPPERQP